MPALMQEAVMPELPEVETTRQGIRPFLEGQRLRRIVVREPRLRWPVSPELLTLADVPVLAVRRRAKYLLLDVPDGQLLMHLGMSGSVRHVAEPATPGKHDHLDLELMQGGLLRYTDPRRFGALLWNPTPDRHPLLDVLGPEPLDAAFDADYLAAKARGRKQAIKTLIMDNHVVVGVGNIYAQESLFLAGIHPSRPAGRISAARLAVLVAAIRKVLADAIAAGGTTLRDFSRADGKPGYFQQELNVYGRGGEPCVQCGAPLTVTRHGQRSTVYCGRCQR